MERVIGAMIFAVGLAVGFVLGKKIYEPPPSAVQSSSAPQSTNKSGESPGTLDQRGTGEARQNGVSSRAGEGGAAEKK